MRNKVWLVCTLAAAVLMIAALILCLTNGACTEMLDCGTKQVPMKCHWAYLATALICGLAVVSALIGLFQKHPSARRVSALLCVICALGALAALYIVIGVCANSAMVCVGHRIPVTICIVIGAIAALVGMAKADDAASKLPKAQL